jgi:hypothetical protein
MLPLVKSLLLRWMQGQVDCTVAAVAALTCVSSHTSDAGSPVASMNFSVGLDGSVLATDSSSGNWLWKVSLGSVVYGMYLINPLESAYAVPKRFAAVLDCVLRVSRSCFVFM